MALLQPRPQVLASAFLSTLLVAGWVADAAPKLLSPAQAARPTPAASRPTSTSIVFNREVRPILAEHCFSCHGFDGEKRQAGLRLDVREGFTGKSAGGRPIIVPGEPNAGEFMRRLTANNALVMPPASTGKRLSPDEIQTLRRWIAQGAGFASHWAYAAPRSPGIPAVRNRGWVRNPVDAFVLARLERAGLTPSPEADPAVLLRRVSLDLTGLPPTPEQVEAFLGDRSLKAYERAVDRLLASPQFGVRWARPWLDLARYADSHGFQRDDLREIWPYRDWVIRALNTDMPFDQFTIEQLAGDLLPNATEAQKVATGFHRCTTTNVEAGSEPEETRVNQVIDRVNTTAAVWLGSTLECAQCHDHKYDPFTRKDYYRLFAYFNSTALEAERSDPKVPGSIRFLGPALTLADPERDGARKQASAELQRIDQQLDLRRRELLASMPAWEKQFEAQAKAAPPADIARILRVSAGKRTAAQSRKLVDFRLSTDQGARTLVGEKSRLSAKVEALQPPTTLVMQELPEPRPSAIFLRGDYRQRGEAVLPGTPAVFPAVPSGPPNRLTLARWLVSAENPLTARVAVNRTWAELFGRGIVPTLEDFGAKGEPPSHPELLDYLAASFRSDWSTKRLIRRIVTSATYRQASRVSPALRERDPENRLLARGPRYRMDAEMIRDNALAVAGLLSLKQGGPPVRPYQPEGLWKKVGGAPVEYLESPGEDRHRRGIYVVWKRATPYPSFVNFDATSRLTCTVKRSRSNTPLQALTLLNDPVYVEAAMALARQVLTAPGTRTERERLRSAFRRVLSRDPVEIELSALERLLTGQRAAYRAAPKAAAELVAPFPKAEGVEHTEYAAWYAVATALLNLDETITKG